MAAYIGNKQIISHRSSSLIIGMDVRQGLVSYLIDHIRNDDDYILAPSTSIDYTQYPGYYPVNPEWFKPTIDW